MKLPATLYVNAPETLHRLSIGPFAVHAPDVLPGRRSCLFTFHQGSHDPGRYTVGASLFACGISRARDLFAAGKVPPVYMDKLSKQVAVHTIGPGSPVDVELPAIQRFLDAARALNHVQRLSDFPFTVFENAPAVTLRSVRQVLDAPEAADPYDLFVADALMLLFDCPLDGLPTSGMALGEAVEQASPRLTELRKQVAQSLVELRDGMVPEAFIQDEDRPRSDVPAAGAVEFITATDEPQP